MNVKINKKPKSPVILVGFPGYGLIGTIATEFIADHLKAETIGKMWLKNTPAIAAIHNKKVVDPISIAYAKKENIVIIHGINIAPGREWTIAEKVLELAIQMEAKEIILLEGLGAPENTETGNTYFYATDKKAHKEFSKLCNRELEEGIIMGITGALMVTNDKIKQSSIFADTHSSMPDSRAAAKIIQILDKYLKLKVDYKPLLSQAELFETKLKTVLEKQELVAKNNKDKTIDYIS